MKKSNIAVTYIGHFGNDLSVVNSARVSMDKTHTEFEDVADTKLIKYLWEHKHKSPFNHAFLSFRVKAPIFVSRQLVKHKFLPWNEVSRRYVDSEPEFYFPSMWRKRAENVKQGSSEEEHPDGWDFNCDVNDSIFISVELYLAAIKSGVCPEQARMILPQNMMTEWIWSGTLGAFIDMLVLRLDHHTQYETRIVAKEIYKHVADHFPVVCATIFADEQ